MISGEKYGSFGMSKDAQITSRIVQVKRREVTLDGVVLPDDGLELLEELCAADGIFKACVVFDRELRQALEDKGYIRTNIRGGSHGTDKLRSVYPSIEAEYMKRGNGGE